MHDASGEVLPRWGAAQDFSATDSVEEDGVNREQPAWFRRGQRRKQLLALIITAKSEALAGRILREMRRGVTALPGTGMFTGEPRAVLLCALTVTEVNHLKALVSLEDPQAFVIVSPAQEILGKGFNPLAGEK